MKNMSAIVKVVCIEDDPDRAELYGIWIKKAFPDLEYDAVCNTDSENEMFQEACQALDDADPVILILDIDLSDVSQANNWLFGGVSLYNKLVRAGLSEKLKNTLVISKWGGEVQMDSDNASSVAMAVFADTANIPLDNVMTSKASVKERLLKRIKEISEDEAA